MRNLTEKILMLTRKLYPTGLAFRFSENGLLENLHRGLIYSENKAYNDLYMVLDSTLPDNMNFTSLDCDIWEKRLGMVVSSAPVAVRKLAIRRKMNYGLDKRARCHYLWVQYQLQSAGFDVWVHENRFWNGSTYETKTAQQFFPVWGSSSTPTQHKTTLLHGQVNHGGATWNNKVANSISRDEDVSFSNGSNLRSTFFIGGETPGDFANVPAIREREFRKLILTLKPTQTVAFLGINYI